ncbi:MAG: hypothetical protein D6815_05155 [Candidatus Dadabacteria bacterium]|nr:MAG: hypothetical protein D6815_05155 [Candidatus Dadabacteria bacterium]
MNQLVDRMVRAAKLEAQLYEEVEADPSCLSQAALVVVLSSLAAGIGLGVAGAHGFGGIVVSTLGSLVGWAIWAGLTYLIGTKVLPEPQTNADFGQLLRTIGFSSAPGVIRILGVIPGLAGAVALVGGVWMLAAMVVAVRQALDYQSTGRAVAVCLIGFVVQMLVLAPLL